MFVFGTFNPIFELVLAFRVCGSLMGSGGHRKTKSGCFFSCGAAASLRKACHMMIRHTYNMILRAALRCLALFLRATYFYRIVGRPIRTTALRNSNHQNA
eukprot:6473945-Amphidinium_carterae.1